MNATMNSASQSTQADVQLFEDMLLIHRLSCSADAMEACLSNPLHIKQQGL